MSKFLSVYWGSFLNFLRFPGIYVVLLVLIVLTRYAPFVKMISGLVLVFGLPVLSTLYQLVAERKRRGGTR